MWKQRVVTFLGLVGSLMLLGQTAFATNGAEIKIRIDAPEKEEQITGGLVYFQGKVRGWEGKPLFARIHGLGRTRQIFLDAEDQWMRLGHDVHISVTFAVPAGSHTVVFDVYWPEDQKVLLSKSRTFAVVTPDEGWLEEQLDEARWTIAGTTNSLEIETHARLWTKVDEDFTQEDAIFASESYRTSVWHSYNTWLLKGYSEISVIYDQIFEPEKALGALALAEEVYAATKNEVISGPYFDDWPVYRIPGTCTPVPTHFIWSRFFHERHGTLDQLVPCMEREAEWFLNEAKRDDLDDDERTAPMEDLAEVYRSLAQYHVMLADDMEGYRKWMNRFQEVVPEQMTRPPHTIWLSVYTRDPRDSLFGVDFDED